MKQYKMGDTVTMLFHCAGLTSEEKWEVEEISNNGDLITIADGFIFSITTGKCINDCNFAGARRELKSEE